MGIYPVILTVTDEDGEFDVSSSILITVDEIQIETPENWDELETRYSSFLLSGDNQAFSVTDPNTGITLGLDINTADAISLAMGIWETCPASILPNLAEGWEDFAVYFMIEVNNSGAIDFPFPVTLTLPEGLENFSSTEIETMLSLFTWNDGSQSWNEENFPMNVDLSAGTITILMEHLSEFSLGVTTIIAEELGEPPNWLMIVSISVGAITVVGVVGSMVYKNKNSQKKKMESEPTFLSVSNVPKKENNKHLSFTSTNTKGGTSQICQMCGVVNQSIQKTCHHCGNVL